MEYNQEVFKEAANKKAAIAWLVMNIILNLPCLAEIMQGGRTKTYIITFFTLAWLPYIIGLVVLKIQGMSSALYKDVVAVGYGIFYCFVVISSSSSISFAYVFSMIAMLLLYKNRRYMIRLGIVNTLAIIFSIIYHFKVKGMNSFNDIQNYILQLICIIVCYIYYVIAIDHMNKTDGALTDSIQKNLERVVNTVEKVKTASNAVVDGVTVVRDLSDENKAGAEKVVASMTELSDNNSILYQRTMSSMDKTADINTQVQNVAALVEQMIHLVQESVDH